MDWVKQNYEKLLLLVAALALAAAAALLFLRVGSFNEVFEAISGEVSRKAGVEPLDMTPLEQAHQTLATPQTWEPEPKAGTLFVAEPYLLRDGQLVPISIGEGGAPVHPPVPNDWILEHDLPITARDVLQQDPDGDGFSNFDEWQGKTDPRDPKSHPPYVTKLRLKQFIQVPFRLIFQAYIGEPAEPETLNFQINTVDVKQPTLFLKLGDAVTGTKFKVAEFEYKTHVDHNEIQHDISELTVEHVESGERVVLVLQKMVNSPDSYALFQYLWDDTEFRVKKDSTFKLAPDEEEYKLIDITQAAAVIESIKTGEQLKIPRLTEPKRESAQPAP